LSRTFAKQTRAFSETISVKHQAPVLIGQNSRFAGALYDMASKQEETKDKSLHDHLAFTGSSLETIGWAISTGRWATMVEESGLSTVEEQVGLMDEYVEKMDLDEIAGELAKELIREEAIKDISSIAQTYLQIYRYKHDVYDALVVSAQPLSEKQNKKVKAQLATLAPKGAHLNYSFEVKPEILGGLQIHIEDQELDFTTLTQLSELFEFVTSYPYPDLEVSVESVEKALKEGPQ